MFGAGTFRSWAERRGLGCSRKATDMGFGMVLGMGPGSVGSSIGGGRAAAAAAAVAG